MICSPTDGFIKEKSNFVTEIGLEFIPSPIEKCTKDRSAMDAISSSWIIKVAGI